MRPFADRPLVRFRSVMALVVLMNVLVRSVPVPLAYLPAANLVVSVLAVTLPVAALFLAAEFEWDWRFSLGAILAGVTAQALPFFLRGPKIPPVADGILLGVSQAGLVTWCLGLGALLVSALRDKNMLLPIALFLALFDIWLVFVPEGPVGQIARGNQEQLARIAYQVPQPVAAAPKAGLASPLAYVGPADFLFLAMFFVALWRFKMRVRETAVAMVPTLAVYLLVALLFGDVTVGPIRLGALPALVPIGLVVLWVNRREFRLTADEKRTTLALFVIGTALLVWRFWENRGRM